MTELEINKMLISPLFVWIPAVFGSRVTRMRGIMAMSISLTLFLTMIYIDDDLRPSIGSRGGPIGIVQFYFIQLIFMTAITIPLTFVALYYFERVTGDIWRSIWFLETEILSLSETWARAWGREPPSAPG